MKDEFSDAIEQSKTSAQERKDRNQAAAPVLGDRGRAAAEECTRALAAALGTIPDLIVQQQPVQMVVGRHGQPAGQIELEGDRAEFTVTVRGHVQWLLEHGSEPQRPLWDLRMTVNVKEGRRSTTCEVPGQVTPDGAFDVSAGELRAVILEALRSA
ncbi:MAG: hypothetical protein GIW99_02765 [Candidatus Eremiobacteraeota bacterium]|nr:hypothetical protein [Candidatus Eremiobacteraeota bacterium]MBC5826596.1 hypothetical protein [Candidatus Eremiobacteraeota bacterium]